MAFYLSEERNKDVSGAYRRYQQYLQENKERFPPGAFALGTAEWWQLAHDHRCPHDGALVSFFISEIQEAETGDRFTTLRTEVRHGYHDGYIELFYPRVFSYQLQSPSSARGLGDWLYDEFRLSAAGHVIHEIEWAGFPDDEGSRWIIEASDVEFEWVPK
jgi:hypothetical protein